MRAVWGYRGPFQERIACIVTERVAFMLAFVKTMLPAVCEVFGLAVALIFGLLYATDSQGQTQAEHAAAKLPAYEVASIKTDKSGTDLTMLRTTPVGFSASNIVLKTLIAQAYGVEDYQVFGAPGWVGSARFDIEAKVSSSDTDALHDLSPDQRRLMLQPLLAERFQLKVHTEARNLPLLALVVAKGGPKLQEAKPGDTYPNGIKGFDGQGGAGLMHMGPGGLTGQGLPISSLARILSQQLGNTVEDKTGLTGKYDFTLQWTPDRNTSPMSPEPGQQGPAASSTDSSGPSIFTAIQEQLGLKLESQKGPVEVLVIDHVETPSEN
jgi:uncharacterized protein (TIGR03435 family)